MCLYKEGIWEGHAKGVWGLLVIVLERVVEQVVEKDAILSSKERWG